MRILTAEKTATRELFLSYARRSAVKPEEKWKLYGRREKGTGNFAAV